MTSGNLEGADMAALNKPYVIALEEHYYDAELAATFDGAQARAPVTRRRLDDLGELRLQEMDAAGIHFQVISHGAPSTQRLDPETAEVRTWLGSGEPGLVDGPATTAAFSEPSGLSVANGQLYIADTNNHDIRVADLSTGEVSTLELRGLEPS